MARNLNKLTDVRVKSETKAGRLSDGGGLHLAVGATGSKSWTFVWTRAGRKREMGLGAYPAVSLAMARRRAADCRTIVADGGDPIAERQREAEPTFVEAAEMLIASIESHWRNPKTAKQWRASIKAHCKSIANRQVSKVDTAGVLTCLKPVWTVYPESALRLRERLERILSFAKAKGWRSGENPALWRGHLSEILPHRKRVTRKHFTAMHYREVGDFLRRLRGVGTMTAIVLEFIILTAARSGEARGALWSEIDLDGSLWRIPAERMKAQREHIVPLSAPALALLERMAKVRHGRHVFPGERPDSGLGNSALDMLLRRLGVQGTVTAHGFRSAFRDWCGDCTDIPREVAEAALGHAVGNAVERSYRRGSALEKRRKLMQDWADYLDRADGANVIKLSCR